MLRYDLPASIVVFLVALPLSLGIAVASNAPILAGIIAAIVGGIVAGVFGGSPLQVSGPAAGLTVVVAGLVAEFGWLVTCAITVCAGILQVLLGMSRVARAALAISPVVVHAMLAGIGITIALQQVHVLLGGDSQPTSWENVTELPAQLVNADTIGMTLGLLVIAIIVAWRWMPAAVRKVPAALVAIVAATVAAVIFALDVPRIELDGTLLDAIQLPELPDGNWGAFAVGVLTVALIASVESLLCAVATDRMHNGPRTNFDRELFGQGAANITSGAMGGLPVTGVIVRSTANVNAGAKSRASTILHGLWILLFAVPFAALAEQIPMAALAGLLIVIGAQLVKRAHIETAMRTGDMAVYLVTVVGVVFINLLQGVLLGLALAILLTVWRVVRAKIHAEPTVDDQEWRIVVDGSATFLSLPRLTKALASVPAGADITVELSVDFIDHPILEAIEEWKRQHEEGGGSVNIQELGSAELESAADGPPARAFTSLDKRAGLAPWSSWQNGHSDHGNGTDDGAATGTGDDDGDGDNGNGNGHSPRSVLTGLSVYHRRTAPEMRPHMEKLAHAQRPETLFITCTDSRVVPNVITSSGPGDLFTVRNIGNVVPGRQLDTSMEAAIAFAVAKLGVSSIVVCGHSSCGAMNTLLSDQNLETPMTEADEYLTAWMQHGQPALTAFADGRHPVAVSAREAGFDTVDQLSMVNVAVQVETLIYHPMVRDLHRHGHLEVIGLFYDIPSANVLQVGARSVNAVEVDAQPR